MPSPAFAYRCGAVSKQCASHDGCGLRLRGDNGEIGVVTSERTYPRGMHPLHAILLASPVPLFLGALLADWAYSASYVIQWTNFASWLIAFGLLFTGLALLWSVISAFLKRGSGGASRWLAPGLLLLTFVVGFFNALEHAQDAWAAMPVGFILSGITFLLAFVSAWIGFSNRRAGERA